jgi:2-haloacid dehalogenase
MAYTWLLFDADDTLFDYPRAEADALRRTFDQFRQVFHQELLNRYQVYNQQVWSEFEHGGINPHDLRLKRFRLLFEEIHSLLDPEEFSQRYSKNLARASYLLPHAETVLHALSGRFHIALVTNGLKDIQPERVKRSTIHQYIEKIFISEEIGVAKPETAFFDFVFSEIGHPPKSKVLIIGDSLASDIRGGLEYGIDTCWFNPNGKITALPITYEIKSLKQLLEFL